MKRDRIPLAKRLFSLEIHTSPLSFSTRVQWYQSTNSLYRLIQKFVCITDEMAHAVLHTYLGRMDGVVKVIFINSVLLIADHA